MRVIIKSWKFDLNGLEFDSVYDAIDYVEDIGYFAMMFPDRGLIWERERDSINDAGESAVGEIVYISEDE